MKVLVGVSGGVDSAVALHLVQTVLRNSAKSGTGDGIRLQSVEAAFMTNWHATDGDPYCTIPQDLQDAAQVCKLLGVTLHQVDFSAEYWKLVFSHCLDQFALGNTPNPDILCNSEIKFGAFWRYAEQQLGADKIVTGHYARTTYQDGRWRLLKGVDDSKDQSYFLHRLTSEQVSRAMFPLGEMTKKEVRTVARELALPVCDKPDSTGICFIGERKFQEFLEEYLLIRPGAIIDQNGTMLGEHRGVYFYTIGQRKGLGIGGTKGGKELPWYVLAKNLKNNTLVVTQQPQDLMSNALHASKAHWINHDIRFPLRCAAKIRYRQRDQYCMVEASDSGDQLTVIFDEPQWAITPGQSVVFYDGDCCLGGAIINGSVAVDG